MKKIYFAGSIRGGRDDHELYKKIIDHLKSFGEVLTEHVGLDNLSMMGEAGMTDRAIYDRDMQWLSSSEVVVAEVSTPSLGVGFEISKAIELKKGILCLFRVNSDRKLSAMISGCPDVQVRQYVAFEDVKQVIDGFFMG
jgi:2'-deoxynucleoside 5'-phosphate N-hydrolase